MGSPEDAIEATAGQYDATGLLGEQALRRLAWRKARSGRVCVSCGLEKALTEFGPDLRETDALDRRCRDCEALRRREARIRVNVPESRPSL